ncbi:hypothetical protein SRHO_G00170020 [Serrasalmus rhombeus]
MLCNYSTKAKLNLIQHVRSMKHQRSESLRKLQRLQKGLPEEEEDLSTIFTIRKCPTSDTGALLCVLPPLLFRQSGGPACAQPPSVLRKRDRRKGGRRKKESASEDALFRGGTDNEASGREIAQKAVTDLRQIIREHI